MYKIQALRYECTFYFRLLVELPAYILLLKCVIFYITTVPITFAYRSGYVLPTREWFDSAGNQNMTEKNYEIYLWFLTWETAIPDMWLKPSDTDKDPIEV